MNNDHARTSATTIDDAALLESATLVLPSERSPKPNASDTSEVKRP